MAFEISGTLRYTLYPLTNKKSSAYYGHVAFLVLRKQKVIETMEHTYMGSLGQSAHPPGGGARFSCTRCRNAKCWQQFSPMKSSATRTPLSG